MNRLHLLINRYKRTPIQAKAAVWFTICNLLQNGLHLITMPIYTRMLTTEQYGLSTLYFAWSDIIIIFTSLKLAAGVFNNGMVHFSDDRDRFQSSMQGLSTVSALICLVVYSIFPQFFESLFGLPHMLSMTIFIYSIFYPSLTYWTARQRYEYKYLGFTIATLGLAVMTSLFSVIFIIFSKDKGSMKIIGYVVAATIINIGFYIYNFCKGKIFYHKNYWLYALKFNLPLIPHYLSMIILNQCDRIMIANMCGESQAGMYGVAYSIGKVVLVFNSAITASFTPWIYEKLKKKELAGISKVSFSLFLLITVIIIGIMLFGPEVILIFATQEYMQAVYVIPPIAASIFFTFIYNQVSTVEFYYGKSKYIMAASLVGSILNIVLNYFAISTFGFIAAAYTSLVCYIFFAVCHYSLMYMLCRKNKISEELFPLKKLLILSTIMIILTLVMNFLYTSYLVRYFFILILLVIVVVRRKKVITLISDLKKH